MLQKVNNVAIDDSVVIPCPKREFKPALVADACPKCEYYDGLGVMSVQLSRPWHERYAVRCACPIERRTQPIKFDINSGNAMNKIRNIRA